MKKQTSLSAGSDDQDKVTRAAARKWWPKVYGNPAGAISPTISQGLLTVGEGEPLAALNPHVWAQSLKLHGIPELNSPLAG